ncbi:MAG: glycerate kinase [Planctomycetota bacterium]|jgi:glycerate kinase
MKIVIAMDSFKGTLKAHQACQITAEAIAQTVADAELVIKPMGDGGEGTAMAMIKAADGQWIPQEVIGPLPDMQVEAGFAWFDADKTALVEMASASGLELISKDQTNPFKTTTYGTGQLIKAALQYEPRKILLAIGGSATVDGGLGAAMALGWKFLDSQNNPVGLGGAALEQIEKIVKPENLNLPPVEVLCDVDNPLCGERGAARVYGPQKGATPQMVEQLEKGLAHLADIVEQQFRCDIKNPPGAGAAGGLAAGAIAFMSASLVSGIETVMAHSNLDAELDSADWVITGEGSFDQQSLYGKVVSGISAMAHRSDTKIAVIAGRVNVPQDEYQKIGIVTAISCKTNDMSLDYALENCRPLLHSAARRFANQYLSG